MICLDLMEILLRIIRIWPVVKLLFNKSDATVAEPSQGKSKSYSNIFKHDNKKTRTQHNSWRNVTIIFAIFNRSKKKFTFQCVKEDPKFIVSIKVIIKLVEHSGLQRDGPKNLIIKTNCVTDFIVISEQYNLQELQAKCILPRSLCIFFFC